MATPAYYYSSTAGTYTLTASITTSSTIINLDGVVGLPGSVPFKVVIDPGQVSEEIVKVTAMAGASLTVVRAWDGTTASSHSAGAVVRHMLTAEDLTLARAHEAASSAVHGITGSVVGTTDAQALTNKNLTGAGNTFPTSLVTLTGTQALTNKDLSGAGNVFPTSLVTLTGTQALTNKDLTGAGNVFPTSLATLTGVQTLTNKTISGGTVNPTTLQKSGVNVPTISETATLTNKTMSGSSNTFSNIPQSAVTGLTTIQSNLNTYTAEQYISTGFVAQPNWTISTSNARIIGKLAFVYLNVTYTGPTVNGNGNGNIGNMSVVQVPASLTPWQPISMATNATGYMASFYLWTDGMVGLGAIPPNIDLLNGHSFSFSGCYMLNI